MRNREEKNICCICGDQKDDFDLITFDQGKRYVLPAAES